CRIKDSDLGSIDLSIFHHSLIDGLVQRARINLLVRNRKRSCIMAAGVDGSGDNLRFYVRFAHEILGHQMARSRIDVAKRERVPFEIGQTVDVRILLRYEEAMKVLIAVALHQRYDASAP